MAAHMTTTWHHVRRSPYQALAAIMIIMLTFFTISVFAFLVIGSYKLINFFESQPQVQIYFNPDTKKEDIDAVAKQLQATGKIAKIKYFSKQDAFSIFKNMNKDDPLMMELVTPDILPPSLDVSTINITDLSSIVDSVKNLPIVHKIGYQKEIVQKLTSWTDVIRKMGLVIIVILGVESLLIMTTIIGVKISQRKEEIEIMRLIGATNIYISYPYVYEGMFYGVVGAVIGWSIAATALMYYSPAILASGFLKGIPLLPVNPLFLLELLAIEVTITILLGVFSSSLAVSRYLD
jgi:cell division transport system permease protein